MTINCRRCRLIYSVFASVFILLLSGCGGYESTLSDADRQLLEQFVAVDAATVDEAGFGELIELRKKLTSGAAAQHMSGEETDQVTVQIEAMISRLESDLAAATDAKVKKSKGRELYLLKKSIGRGGA